MRASSSNRGGLCARRVAGRPLAQTAPVRGSGQTHMRVPSQAQGADTPLHIAGLARACRLRAALTGYRLRAACRTNRRKKDHHLTMAGARAIWATEGAGATAPFRHPRAMACRFRLPLRCPIGSVRSAIAQMQARQAPLCLRAISARATGIRRPRAFLASPGRTPLPTAILPGAMLQLQLMLQLPVTRMPAILVLFTSKPMKASRRLIDASNGRFGAAAAVSVMAVEEARIQWHGRMARASRSHLRPHDSEPQSLHKVNACVYCPSCILVGTSVRSRVYGSSARALTLHHAHRRRECTEINTTDKTSGWLARWARDAMQRQFLLQRWRVEEGFLFQHGVGSKRQAFRALSERLCKTKLLRLLLRLLCPRCCLCPGTISRPTLLGYSSA
jgi:hypothetical protein